MGEDSKRRAVVKGCDQRDQERATCRSGLTKGAGAACSYKKALQGRQKSKFMRGTVGLGKGTGSHVRGCVFGGRSPNWAPEREPAHGASSKSFLEGGSRFLCNKQNKGEKLEGRQCRDAGSAPTDWS